MLVSLTTEYLDLTARKKKYLNRLLSDPPVQKKNLLKEFKRLDDFLNSHLPEEIDHHSTETIGTSNRKFLDGNRLTLADCNLLPKLHVIRVRRFYDFSKLLKHLKNHSNVVYLQNTDG